MKQLNFFIMIISILLVPAQLMARPLGQVQASAGEVYVRSSGSWARLSGPRLLYSTDKLYTKQGRSELVLEGGGVIRLDAWTSISMKKADDPNNTSPVLRVVTGNVWFDLQSRRVGLEIRTPAAAVRTSSSSGQVMADSRNGTRIGFLNEGESELTGRYETVTASNPPLLQSPIGSGLSEGDPAIHSSLDDAIRAHREVNRLLMWDNAERIRSRKAFYSELSRGSLVMSDSVAGMMMDAAVARSDAALGIAQAHLAGMRAQLAEEELMGENANVQKIQGLMVEAEKDQDTITADAKEIRKLKSKNGIGMNAEGFITASSAAIIANRSRIEAELIHIKSLLGISAGKTDSMMRTVLSEASRYASRMEPLLSNMERIEMALSGGESDSSLLVVLTATTTKNSADIISGCVSGLADRAGGVASDSNGQGEAAACRFASTAYMASDRAVSALNSGDAAGVVDALRTTEEAIKNSGTAGLLAGGLSEMSDIYGTPILDKLDIAGEPGSDGEEIALLPDSEISEDGGLEEPPISPHDLATASPSE